MSSIKDHVLIDASDDPDYQALMKEGRRKNGFKTFFMVLYFLSIFLISLSLVCLVILMLPGMKVAGGPPGEEIAKWFNYLQYSMWLSVSFFALADISGRIGEWIQNKKIAEKETHELLTRLTRKR